ncbi:MAG: hypothetical protein ABEJ40_05530 [Haloarculaceae archaeon]
MTPLVSVILMVAVTLVVAMVLVVGASALLPSDGDLSVRPDADFTVERRGGDLVFEPTYMTEGVPFTLLVNGEAVYTWEGGNTERARRLSCLNAGDDVYVRADAAGDRTFSIEKHEVAAPTDCALPGAASRFAYARVGDRSVPILDTDYEFTLSIDPDGPDSVNGDVDFPATNPWVYVQRYDRKIEGLEPPVYVVVFPDNVGSVSDWRSEPSDAEREEMTQSYEVNGEDVVVTAGGVEPTDDVYLVFKPGCSKSQFKFLRMQGGYNNQILLDGTELFRTDDANRNQVYDGPGVKCT